MNYDLVWKYSSEEGYLYKLDKRNDNDNFFELYTPEDDGKIENLSYLKFINIPSILNVLDLRYKKDKIYTFNGEVLISINPFKTINNLYVKINDIDMKIPHIYSIAEKAFRGFNSKNQSILVSGESGSGKTENTKYILRYLSYNYADNSDTSQTIINSNHIIEMLGNSKTLRNDNSSRFGKFIKLYLDNSKIIGANIENYLLEKSRITVFNKKERSYHIFYALDNPCLEKYKFKKDYKLLKNTDNSIISEFKDIKLFIDSLKLFDLNSYEIDRIFITLKVILELLDIENLESLETQFKLLDNELEFLKIDNLKLIFNFSNKTIKVGGEIIHKPLDYDEIAIQIKSYCEDLYSGLFDWVISKINKKLGKTSNQYISILDIFGFEILENNGYEQLCINYTNEILQQIYNRNVLENEQTEYVKEGIDWDMINYNSNSHIVKLFNSKLSIFGIINEQSILGSGNNKKIYSNFHSKLCKESDIISISKTDYYKNKFTIKHYAGEVDYIVDNYIIKNRIKSKNRKIKTNLHLFTYQLDQLTKELNKNKCLFVRCIKPNDENTAENYNQVKINDQLLYSGIIEGIKLILKGFPVKIKLDQIEKEFKFLKFNNEDVIQLLTKNEEYGKKFAIGKSKLFLKKDIYNSLLHKNSLLRFKIVVIIQTTVRKWLDLKKYKKIKKAIIVLQGFYRIIKAKKIKHTLKKEKATKFICNKIYSYIKRKNFLNKRKAIIYLQSIVRKYNQIKRFKKLLIKKTIENYLSILIGNVIDNYIKKTSLAANKIIMFYRRCRIKRNIKKRKDVSFLKQKLVNTEKLAKIKLQEHRERILMEKEELLVLKHREHIRHSKQLLQEKEKLRLMKLEIEKNEKEKREKLLSQYKEKEELNQKVIMEKEEKLKDSLDEIRKLKQLLLQKNKPKIQYIDNHYISNKKDRDDFREISLEDEQSAVEQVSQKLEKMYLDLNEKNSRIDFLIKKYRDLEQQKKEKNCIIM